jgi:hypothetical protein
MFQSDPFSAKSPSPLLKTTSSPLQIRQNRDRVDQDQNSSRRSSGESKGDSSGCKKNFLFGTALEPPRGVDGADQQELIVGGSPLPRTRPQESLSSALIQSRKSASSDITAAPVGSTRRSRGISSWFRQGDKSAEPGSNKESSVVGRTSDGGAAREAQVSQYPKY